MLRFILAYAFLFLSVAAFTGSTFTGFLKKAM